MNLLWPLMIKAVSYLCHMAFYKTHLFRASVLFMALGSSFIVSWNVYHNSWTFTEWYWQLGIALYYTWIIMFCTFMLFQLYGTIRLPQGYYRFRNFETPGYFYFLGVNLFQFILVNSFFKKFNPRVYMEGRDRSYIFRLYHETKHSETSHFIGVFISLGLALLYWNENWMMFWFIMIFNIIFNVYPMLLQRMNRSLLETKFGRERMLEKEKQFLAK